MSELDAIKREACAILRHESERRLREPDKRFTGICSPAEVAWARHAAMKLTLDEFDDLAFYCKRKSALSHRSIDYLLCAFDGMSTKDGSVIYA